MTKAIILLSGGLDSTVVLALAIHHGKDCFALTFDYGQKNSQEIKAAKQIARYYGVKHQIIPISPALFQSSSLVSTLECPKERSLESIKNGGIPNTYVPARNTLFLAYALSFCESLQADEIHFGPNAHDLSSYPDCSPNYLSTFQELMCLATKQSVEGHPPLLITPCLRWRKEDIIYQGELIDAPLHMTWSCYSPINEQACGSCDACILRASGFKEVSKNKI